MSALTDLLIKDWHVGVSPSSIITTEKLVKEFDLKTDKAEDIDFKSDFCLKASGPGYKQFNVSTNFSLLLLYSNFWHYRVIILVSRFTLCYC